VHRFLLSFDRDNSDRESLQSSGERAINQWRIVLGLCGVCKNAHVLRFWGSTPRQCNDVLSQLTDTSQLYQVWTTRDVRAVARDEREARIGYDKGSVKAPILAGSPCGHPISTTARPRLFWIHPTSTTNLSGIPLTSLTPHATATLNRRVRIHTLTSTLGVRF
jgi:hypothetical protein